MAKSNETFNKKEKEKKRLKKQQDKKEKAEERRAGSIKGKSLDDMMAYVDENGNITSTPPSHRPQRQQVSLDDISISTPKQVDEPEDALKTGVISFFNTSKGFGFIRDGRTGENVFFHVNNLTYQAKENDKVSYTTEKSPRGLSAVGVKKA